MLFLYSKCRPSKIKKRETQYDKDLVEFENKFNRTFVDFNNIFYQKIKLAFKIKDYD